MEQAPKTAKRRRQGHISVACLACKNRRSKCSGTPPPCSLCAKLDTECHFDPDADMRRRTSRDSTKTYKALLDAFIDSLRRDDASLSRSLHQVIISADPSGRLREVAEEYADSIHPAWLLHIQGSQVDGVGRFDDTAPGLALELPTVEDLDDYLGLSAYSLSNASSPVNQIYAESSSLITPFSPFQQLPVDGVGSSSSTPIYPGPYQQAAETEEAGGSRSETFVDGNVSKEDLKVYLQGQQDNRQLTTADLPIFACDILVSEPADPVSRNILAFRDSARQAINSGIAIDKILETPKPDLTLMFRDRLPTDPHTAWSWACDFSKSYDRFSFSLRLATAYIVGIQMRVCGDPVNGATKSNHRVVFHQSLRRNLQ